MLLAELMVIEAKAETTYGTDATPTITNAILCSNVDVTPLSSQVGNRQKAHATFGLDTDVHTNVFSQMTFDVGLAGAGAAGTAPLYGPLLKACNMTETVVAGTSAAYTLGVFTATSPSATIYFNWSGKRYKLTGARGTVSFMLGPNGLPSMKFTFTGLVNSATNAALPSVEATLASWIDEIEVNSANTDLTMFAITPVLQNFQLDLNNTVTPRDRPNAAIVSITNATPKGQIAFEMPTIATLNVEAQALVGTLGAFSLTHGTVAGNIIMLTCSNMQLIQPKPQVTDGIVHVQSNFYFTRNAGLDDTTLTVK